jgi:hypothetical protein
MTRAKKYKISIHPEGTWPRGPEQRWRWGVYLDTPWDLDTVAIGFAEGPESNAYEAAEAAKEKHRKRRPWGMDPPI